MATRLSKDDRFSQAASDWIEQLESGDTELCPSLGKPENLQAIEEVGNLWDAFDHLTNDDIEAIFRSTGLSEYRPAGEGVQLESRRSGEEFHPTEELQEELRESWQQLADFLSGHNSVAIDQ